MQTVACAGRACHACRMPPPAVPEAAGAAPSIRGKTGCGFGSLPPRSPGGPRPWPLGPAGTARSRQPATWQAATQRTKHLVQPLAGRDISGLLSPGEVPGLAGLDVPVGLLDDLPYRSRAGPEVEPGQRRTARAQACSRSSSATRWRRLASRRPANRLGARQLAFASQRLVPSGRLHGRTTPFR